MSEGWALDRGARPGPDGSTRFVVWAPRARGVSVRLNVRGRAREHPLDCKEGGVFEGVVPDVPAGTDYRLLLDGARDCPDPVSRHQPKGVHGPSRVVDPRSFPWTDAGWKGIKTPDLLFYEIHVGTFTEAGTFEAVIDRLAALRDLGVTAIELMPVAEFPGSRNWGYDGVSLYAPQSTYGGPEGLFRLVDACHAAGLALFLDVVYNHLGPEGNYLTEFGPYFSTHYHTPWGPAMNFDGPESDEVRRFFVDNALFWITEYHVDGLRLDAVQGIFDFGARHVLEEIADAVHAKAAHLGRSVQVIAEGDLNDPRHVRPPERGGYGLDAVWSDDFQRAIHAVLTGERNGYYVDFGGIAQIAKALRDRFVLDGAYSMHHRRRHGAPVADLPADRFVVFAQNHDQVGNRPHGERLATLVSFELQKLAAAIVLLSPYVPLLFMGEEYGEISPFLYFTSHSDPDVAEAVRRGRARDLKHFQWRGKAPDPQAEETFFRSRLDPDRAAKPGHAQLLALYRDLIHIRRAWPALRPGGADARVTWGEEDGWIALGLSRPDRADALTVVNLSNATRTIQAAVPEGSAWRRALCTEDPKYGGSGPLPPSAATARGGVMTLEAPAASAALYLREDR